MNKAIDIIRSEHQALAAVLSGLSAVIDGIGAGKFEPNFTLLAAMTAYVTEVPLPALGNAEPGRQSVAQ